MATSQSERAAQVGAILGEGPVWVERTQMLWFVDIKARRVHRFDPETAALAHWNAPDQVGWILPAHDGAFVVGLRSGPARFEPATGHFGTAATLPSPCPGDRLNDATTGADGRLWFGTMDDAEEVANGRLFVADRHGIRDTSIARAVITNGPAIAPDGRTLYHTDTLARAIHAIPLNDDGSLGTSRIFARTEEGAGYPDGPVVDSAGHVWSGLFGGWGVRRYAPDGRLVETVGMPTANVTKIAFGGTDLRTAYATTARKGLSAAEISAQPAGDLFAFTVDCPGQQVTEVAASF